VSRIVLASTSRYRRELLSRLRLPFDTSSPNVDESELEGEAPDKLALRLAEAKAATQVAAGAIVIGSDQVAALGKRILRKPGGAERAVEQLLSCQGRSVDFFTAAVVIDGASGQRFSTIDRTRVLFRRLERRLIERYVELEEPYDCAGGFKVESLGIVLFNQIETLDPTALMGLPMIWLAEALSKLGMSPLE